MLHLTTRRRGARIDVHLDGDLIRQYSLLPTDGDASIHRIAIKRDAEGRGGSTFVHDRLKVVARLEVGERAICSRSTSRPRIRC